MRTPLRIVTVLCALSLAVAQTTSTTVLGTTTDSSSAAVPGVEISVTHLATNQTRTVISNELGYYAIPGLEPGAYRIAARKQGFKRQVRANVLLQVNQKLTVDFPLEVGEVVESVEVTAEVAALDSASASLGTVVDQRKIVDLPLNGRNYAQLAWLVPGVTPGQRHSNDTVNFSNPFQISANGQRQFNTEVTMDGLSINNALLNQSNLRPSIDAVQEFRVQTGNYSAEFGFLSGAQVNLVLKSGTNSLHGTLFEFLRNDKLDARDFFAAPGQPRPPFKQNQFGVTGGGPVRKDKTFFFASYEGFRRRKNLVGSAVVPTLAQRSGDFSSLTTPLRDPDNPGQFFTDNKISASRLSPEAQKVLRFMPLPNVAGSLNFVGATISQANQDQGFIRVDHSISERDRLFFRYGIGQQHVPEIQLNPNFSIVQDIRDQNGVISHSHLFGSSTLSELRLGYNRANDVFLGPDRSSFSPLADLGISGVAEDPRLKGVPSISIPGLLGIAEHFLVPLTQMDWTYTVSENLTHTFGRHSVKTGFDIRKSRMNRFFQQANRGGFNFTGVLTGNAIADFQLGRPADTSRAVGPGIFNAIRQVRQGYYVQDDWRVTSKLTLNLGLRYELIGVPDDVHGNLRTFDFKTNKLIPEFGVTQGMYKSDHNNLAPRFGFAYSPFKLGGKQTVLRGGYGIYYNASPLQIYTVLGNNPPASLTEAFNIAGGQRLTLANGFPGSGAAPAFPALLAISDDFRPGYVQSWAFTVQQEVWRSSVFEIGYVGSKSTGLDQTVALNMPTPGPGNNQLRRPIPTVGAIRFFSSDSNATYHGLQTRFERRLNTGLTLLAAYTFSKTIDDNFIGTSTPLNTARWAQDPTNRKAEKSRSSFDVPHRLSVTYLYEPYRAKTAGGSRALGELVRNWQVSGTTTAQSGLGWTANVSGDPANLGAFGTNIRANRVGPSRPDGFEPDPFLWVSRAAFSLPDRATDAKCVAAPASCNYYGNLGRLTEPGPGIFNWDVGIARNFAVRENHRLEFRFEMFNMLNRPHFDTPNRNVDTAIFGRITGTNPQIPNRDLQFALKYVF
ncbi:MAG TPA: TonB-dependent receptor [Bryobacteraceae bacterium]|nr:TonB-dependent receptor [Bryobacteraceae bacterium]